LVDFVEEVDEQIRAERLATFARLYLPWFAAALLALIVGWLGVWGYDAWRDRNIGAASVAYDKALGSLQAGDTIGAYNALDAVAKDGPGAYRALALMQQANIRLSAGKGAEAAALFDAAAKASPNAIFHDLSALRAAQAVLDTAPYAQVETRLKPLIGDKRPYSLEARETLAMAKLLAGRAQEARGDFNALGLTLGVSQEMRVRAQSAIALIDSGQAPLVAQVVRLAATLPPSAGPIIPGLTDAQGPGSQASGAQGPESQRSGGPPAKAQGGPPSRPADQNPAGTPE